MRAASALSQHTQQQQDHKSGTPSRATSAISDKSRPVSVLSMLSNMTWTTEKTHEVTYLQSVYVSFNIKAATCSSILTNFMLTNVHYHHAVVFD